MRKVCFFILVISLLLVFSCPMLAQGQAKFNDVTITAFCDAGHNARPFEWYADEFAKAGIKVNVGTAPLQIHQHTIQKDEHYVLHHRKQ